MNGLFQTITIKITIITTTTTARCLVHLDPRNFLKLVKALHDFSKDESKAIFLAIKAG